MTRALEGDFALLLSNSKLYVTALPTKGVQRLICPSVNERFPAPAVEVESSS